MFFPFSFSFEGQMIFQGMVFERVFPSNAKGIMVHHGSTKVDPTSWDKHLGVWLDNWNWGPQKNGDRVAECLKVAGVYYCKFIFK